MKYLGRVAEEIYSKLGEYLDNVSNYIGFSQEPVYSLSGGLTVREEGKTLSELLFEPLQMARKKDKTSKGGGKLHKHHSNIVVRIGGRNRSVKVNSKPDAMTLKGWLVWLGASKKEATNAIKKYSNGPSK